MTQTLGVVALNATKGIAVLTDGQVISLSHLIDGDGNECTADDDIAGVVAGPDRDGRWYSVLYADYERVKLS